MSLDTSQQLVEALVPEEYPDAGGIQRARELLQSGVRLTDADWYNFTIGQSWDVIRLNGEYHAVPSTDQMASCLQYALVHVSPGDKLAGVESLLHAIGQASDPVAYACEVRNLARGQGHSVCATQLNTSNEADDRQAGRVFAEWLNIDE